MNIITILPNGAVIDGDANENVIEASMTDRGHQVFASERLDTWFENVGFMGRLVPVGSNTDGEVRNASATMLHIPADDRGRIGFHGPVFIVGLDGRTPTDLPASVTVAEVERLIALYEDH